MASKVSDRTLDKILFYLTEKLSYNTIHKKLNEWKKESQNTKKHFELEKNDENDRMHFRPTSWPRKSSWGDASAKRLKKLKVLAQTLSHNFIHGKPF